MIRAGDLRHKITIYTATYTENTAGENVVDFSTTFKANVPAEILPVSAKERLANSEISEVVTHRIHIRYLAGVGTDMRIKFGDTWFSIDSVIDPELRHIELWIMAFEEKPIGVAS